MYTQWGKKRPDNVAYEYEVVRAALVVRSEASPSAMPTGRVATSGERLRVAERVKVGEHFFLRLVEGGFVAERDAASGAPLVTRKELEKRIPYTKVSNFAFSHDEKKGRVAVYIDLPGVHELPSKSIEVEFGPRSFDVRVTGLGEANFRLKMPETYDMLDPEGCKTRIKRDKIVLSLKCGEPAVPFGSWQTLSKS